MKVPKPLLVQLIKMMCPDNEKQQMMLDILDKVDVGELQSTEDVTKILNNPDALSQLADTACSYDG